MKLVKILSLLALLHFASCSTDESQSESESEKDIKSYHSGYMDYVNLYNGASGSVRLEYDSKNRIIKRIGGLAPLPASIGLDAHNFSDQVTEDIVYNNNEIKITRKTPNCVCFFERKMILDSKNRIEKKIIYKEQPKFNDSIFYTYNNLNQIEETLKLHGRPEEYFASKIYERAKYYYNPQQNLDSIVTVSFEKLPLVAETEIYRTVEKFSSYDNATNQLKKLIIFDEIYLRAISKNNYAKYENLYYKNNELIQKKTSKYEYRYDASGNINYDFENRYDASGNINYDFETGS